MSLSKYIGQDILHTVFGSIARREINTSVPKAWDMLQTILINCHPHIYFRESKLSTENITVVP